jgi:putative ABC transport system permease protein
MSVIRDSLYLAGRYLAHHRVKTAILVASIAIISFLPVGLNVLVARSGEELMARAESTPLLVGAKGSPLELVLRSLYFESDSPAPGRYGDAQRIAESGLAEPIPLYVRFNTRGHPIVGTPLEYLDFRGLTLASGRRMAMLGECVVGAEAARELGVETGGTLVSSPESAFDLAGTYPLELQVVGVLERAFSPDDGAVFVDLKTAWIIEGLGHGHQDLTRPEAEAAVVKREADRITANASLVQYNRITAANRDSFHFHGDLSHYPVTAIIALPRDARARALLMGRFASPDEPSQIIRPETSMAKLLDTIFTVRSYLVAAIAVVGLATLATASLVFMLSFQLRRREIDTMMKIGGAQTSVAAILASEVLVVLALGLSLAGILTLLTQRFGSEVIRVLLLSA